MMPSHSAVPEQSLEDQNVTQLLQASENEMTLRALVNHYRMSIEQNRSVVRELIIRTIKTLYAALSPGNLQNSRIKLSRILNFAASLFPSANLPQWFMNPGQNIPDEMLPGMLRESLRRNPELRAQLPYLIGLTSAGLWKLGQSAATADSTSVQNDKTFIVIQEPLETILANYIFRNQGDTGENYFLFQAPAQLGGLHYTILVTQWQNGTLHIGILDSLGFDATNQQPHFANIYSNTILQMAPSYGVNVRVYANALKRQSDIISCPQFILNDFFTFKEKGFFNYVRSIMTERQDLVRQVSFGSPYSNITLIPEHPNMLMPMQSHSALDIAKQSGLVERFIQDPVMFYARMGNYFWPVGGLGGKSLNVKAQADLFLLLPLLLADIL